MVKNGWARTPVGLYDLEKDPGEKKNLIKTHPEKAEILLKQWEKWDKDNVQPGALINN